MSTQIKVVLLQVWYFVAVPALAAALYVAMGTPGAFLFLALFVFWCWQIFAFAHYRYCRQEEFLFVLRTAAATKAPFESVLAAYLSERPRGELYRFWQIALLCFVFPGYYLIHMLRSFDTRIQRVLRLLDNGYALDAALRVVPGVAAREVALAASVGQYSGRLPETLQSLPEQRTTPMWLELAPRLLYPLMILAVLQSIMTFIMLFIIPRYEKIFADFRMKLPVLTEMLISASRWLAKYMAFVALWWVLALVLVNVVLFSSRAKWYFPIVGRLYRLKARGEFLKALGIMMDTGKPLPEILTRVMEAGLLPPVVTRRVHMLASDLAQGQPLASSLVRRELITPAQQGLITAAENARNLPWALQELGTTLTRRSASQGYRLVMVVFPLAIFLCAVLVAFVALSMFAPLTALIEGVHGKN